MWIAAEPERWQVDCGIRRLKAQAGNLSTARRLVVWGKCVSWLHPSAVTPVLPSSMRQHQAIKNPKRLLDIPQRGPCVKPGWSPCPYLFST